MICTLVDNNTGEILNDSFVMLDPEQKIKQKKIISFNRKRTEFEENLIYNYGHFYFSFYNKLPKSLEKQYIFRFLYLCTYLKFDDNRLMKRVSQNKYDLIRGCDLMKLLQLSEREYYKTKGELENNKLITINKDKSISINEKISFIGAISKNNKQEYSRIFKESIQELYINSKPREHKRLALFIELLPFIHFKYNVICKNPTCNLMEDIEPFTIQEIRDITNSYTGKNITKFKNQILNIMVNGQKAIMIVEDCNKKFIIVNPSIYYKSNNINDLEYLINLFKI